MELGEQRNHLAIKDHDKEVMIAALKTGGSFVLAEALRVTGHKELLNSIVGDIIESVRSLGEAGDPDVQALTDSYDQLAVNF
jgi:hypothetical protein